MVRRMFQKEEEKSLTLHFMCEVGRKILHRYNHVSFNNGRGVGNCYYFLQKGAIIQWQLIGEGVILSNIASWKSFP